MPWVRLRPARRLVMDRRKLTLMLKLALFALTLVCVFVYDTLGSIASALLPAEPVCVGTTCFHWFSVSNPAAPSSDLPVQVCFSKLFQAAMNERVCVRELQINVKWYALPNTKEREHVRYA